MAKIIVRSVPFGGIEKDATETKHNTIQEAEMAGNIASDNGASVWIFLDQNRPTRFIG